MKKILLPIIVTFLLLDVFSCKKSSERPQGHLIPDSYGNVGNYVEYVDNDGKVFFFYIITYLDENAAIVSDPMDHYSYAGAVTIPALFECLGEEFLVTKVDIMAFHDCDSLFSVIIPNSVSVIEEEAFARCDNLQEVVIPISVKEIGSGAFRDCSMLNSIDIPFTVTKLADEVFYGCGFESFDVPDGITEIGYGAFGECRNLVSISIPGSVKKIGRFAFRECSMLNSITIPGSVKYMGGDVFDCCDNLVTIICLADIPPTVFNHYGNYPFLGRHVDPQEIRVPSASVDAYRTADGWKDYADKIVGM